MMSGQPADDVREPAAKPDAALKRNLVLGVLFVTILSGPAHFALDWIGRNQLAAILLPVNESVWEHLKLIYLPATLWILGSWLFWKKRRPGFDSGRWLLAGAASMLIALLFMLVFFYTYTGAFGIESFLLDVLSLPAGLALGQAMAWHILRYARPRSWHRAAALGVFLLLLIVFAVFTFRAPVIPLFRDRPTGTYGFQ